jgi:hypothetical protein
MLDMKPRTNKDSYFFKNMVHIATDTAWHNEGKKEAKEREKNNNNDSYGHFQWSSWNHKKNLGYILRST